jgi:DNA-nicking Smr family endonuclease
VSGKGGRKETRREALSGEDRALWGEVTKSIAPLRARAVSSEPAEPIEEAPRAPKRPPPARPPAPPPKLAPKAPALATIDRRTKQRLSRGTTEIDARLDLHSMTQAAARTRLESFLKSAQARGHGLVLVITGKGRPGNRDSYGEEERGVLRRQVPQWLSLPDFRPLVVGFSEAAIGHGGTGALYVRVRKAR